MYESFIDQHRALLRILKRVRERFVVHNNRPFIDWWYIEGTAAILVSGLGRHVLITVWFMEAHFQCADPEDPGKNQCYNGKRQIQVQKFFNLKISTKWKQSKTILMDKTGVELLFV